MSFADERDADPPAADHTVTVEPAGEGVQVWYARGGVMLMKVWIARSVASKLEADLDDVTLLLREEESIAAYTRAVRLFREVAKRGTAGGTVSLPDNVSAALLRGLRH